MRFLRCAWRFVLPVLGMIFGSDTLGTVLPPGFVETQVSGYWPNGAVGITFDEVGTMYQWDRDGRVWVFDNDLRLPTPVIDLRQEVGSWHDHGLLGFALHPNFRQNGYLYLMYVVDHHHLANFGTPNYNPNANEPFEATIGRITRYTARASDNFRSVDPASRTVLVGETASTGIPILNFLHGVGSLVFGTDGTLMFSCGESTVSGDFGSDATSYFQQALDEGIIEPKENVGIFRSQLLDSHNGKVFRIDPITGDGIPSNPFFDPTRPRSARSRAWALGLRNPFRMSLRPETGSHNRADADPGVLFIGDVGYSTWEELNICTRPGMNFGWPIYEGYMFSEEYALADPPDADALNPLYGINGCTQRYFTLRNLFHEATPGTPTWPNPCDLSQQIPASIPRFMHDRPVLDWLHDTPRARTGIFQGTNATTIDLNNPASPVPGPNFAGNCSAGGAWYRGDDFPAQYKNTFFFADYGEGWIRNLRVDSNYQPVSVTNFAIQTESVVALATHPISGALYYVSVFDGIFKITYGGNAPPKAMAGANVTYGPGPLTVNFNANGSLDPEGFPLRYSWNFGDGSPLNTNANPVHVFNAPPGVPTQYEVTLTVTDNASTTHTARLVISVNNTPPAVAIVSPSAGTTYTVSGDTLLNLVSAVTDSEHTTNEMTAVWRTDLHHNNHIHPGPNDPNWTTTTVLSPVGCDGETYFYRVNLTVTDAAGLSSSVFVDLYPSCSNTPPTISAVANQTIGEDANTGAIAFTVGDGETAPGNLTVSGSSSNPSLVPNGNIVFGGSGANRTVTVTPLANQFGSATITVTVSDVLSSTNETFLLTVTPVADAPTISALADQTIVTNTSAGPLNFTVGDAETAASSLTVSGTSSNPALIPNSNIVFGGNGANRTVTVTPVAGQAGSATITVTVSDGTSTASELFIVNVTPGQAIPTYLFAEGFEGAGYENTGWSEGGAPNEDYTAVALHGTQSLRLLDTQYSYRPFAYGNSFYLYFRARWNARADYANILNWDNGAWGVTAQLFMGDGSIWLIHGSADAGGTTTINPGTTYHIWVEWTRGTGNNGTMKLFVSTDGNKPATPEVNIPNGNGAAPQRLFLGPSATGSDMIVDRLLVDDVAIGSNPGEVQIPNEPPAVSDITDRSIAENTSTGPINFTVADAETSAGALTVTGTSSNPTLVPNANLIFGGSGANRTLTITPAPSQSGSATITVTVSDGTATANDTFELTVTPVVNTPPTISDVAAQSINEDANTGAIPFTVGDGELAPGSLAVSGTSSNPGLVPNANIVFGGSGANRTVNVTPAVNQFGSATITLTVSDGALTASDTFVLTVAPVEDTPTITALADQTILTNTSVGPLSFTIGDAETAAGSLILSGTSSNPSLVPNGNIVFGGSGANRTVTVNPLPAQTGSATITVTVGDGTLSASESFALTVNPGVPPATYLLSEGFEGAGYENTGWSEGGTPDENYSTTALHGTQSLRLMNTQYTYRPFAYGNSFHFYFRARWNSRADYANILNWDNGAWTVTAQLFMGGGNIWLVHGAASAGGTTIINPGTTYHIWVEWTRGTGNNGAMKLFMSTDGNRPATPEVNITNGSGAAVQRLFLGPSATGSDMIVDRLLVDDVEIGSNPGEVQIPNQPPTISDIADRSIAENTSTGQINFTVGDADTSASALTVTATSSNPTLVPNVNLVLGGSGANRTLTITPAPSQSGTATITITVSDGSATASDTFVLTVTPVVNTQPTISDVANQSINEDASTGDIPFTVGDGELAPGSLVVTGSSSNPSLVPNGNIVFGGSGANRSVNITAATNQFGNATITLTLSDGALTASDTFVVTVAAVNDTPTISAVADQTILTNTSAGPLNFTIGDAETAAASLIISGGSSNPSLVPDGSIVFGGSGANRTVTVTPLPGQTGSATITVTVSDGTLSASELFTLTVNPGVAPPTYLFSEGFEGSGYENTGWSESGTPDENHTTAPLHGSQSLRLIDTHYSYRSFAYADRFHMYFRARWNARADYANILNWDNGAWSQVAQLFMAGGNIWIIHGGAMIGGTTIINPGTMYHVWVEWTRGTGNNGTMKLFISIDGNKPAAPEASISAGTGAATQRLFLGPSASGADVIFDRFLVDDVEIGSNPGEVQVPNQPPTISDIADRSIAENASTGPVSFTVGDAETSASALTVTGTSSNPTLVPNANLVFGGSGANRTLNITPAASQSGSTTITVSVSDGSATASDTFVLTVTPVVNTPPTISNVSDQSINEDANTGPLAVTVGDSELAPGNLTLTGSSSNPALVPNANITFGGSGANRTVTVTPLANQFGTATITLTVSDGALTASDTFVLTVAPVNDSPTISALADQTILTNTSAGPLSFTIGDAETAAASLVVSGASSNPGLVPNGNIVFGGSGANRTVTVTPLPGQTGTAIITVTASDGALGANELFTLTVNPGVAPPTYLFSEGFEGVGYENTGWSESGTPDENYATAPLHGAQSLRLTGTQYIYRSFAYGNAFNMYFRARWNVRQDYVNLMNWDNGAWGQVAQLFMGDGNIWLIHGADSAGGSTVITTGVTYHVWVEWTRGTGNNGTMKLFVSTDGSKPASPEASLTSGDGGATQRFFLGPAATGADIVYDRLLVDDVEIGGTQAQGQSLTTIDRARLRIATEGDRVVLSVEGPQPEYFIQASSDLLNWKPIGSVNGAAGRLVLDGEMSLHRNRFYRALANE